MASKKQVKNKKKRHVRVGKLDMTHLQEAEPGMVFQWMNNEEGNINYHLADGWVTVKGEGLNNVWNGTDEVSQKSTVIRRPVGRGRTVDDMEAILMKIPRDLHAELKEPEYDRIAEKKLALKRGASQDGQEDGPQTYAPNLPDGGKGFSETLQE